MLTESCKKVANEFYCEKCDYTTSRKSSFDKHLLSSKHNNLTLFNKKLQKVAKSCKQYCCDNCRKIYETRTGLWYHKKKCPNKPLENTLVTNNAADNKDIILELLKQNNEFKQMIIELAKEPKTVNNTMTNSNNNNTNNFNLNFFLNTTCKDAITADQFVENIQITFDDLENVGNSGYVKGITDIIMKQLRTLELTERPFHCTDVKRETIYIKEADTWNKDNEEKTKMKSVVGKVARKNLCKIKEWNREHPDVNVLDSKDYNMAHKIIRHSFGDGEDEKLQNDVVKNLSKEVRVEKKNPSIENLE